MQVLAPIGRDASVEDVVMAALDDVDRVDLQVAQVRHRCRRGRRAGAEGLGGIEPLGMQPDSARLGRGEQEGRMVHQGRRLRDLAPRSAGPLPPVCCMRELG